MLPDLVPTEAWVGVWVIQMKMGLVVVRVLDGVMDMESLIVILGHRDVQHENRLEICL